MIQLNNPVSPVSKLLQNFKERKKKEGNPFPCQAPTASTPRASKALNLLSIKTAVRLAAAAPLKRRHDMEVTVISESGFVFPSHCKEAACSLHVLLQTGIFNKQGSRQGVHSLLYLATGNVGFVLSVPAPSDCAVHCKMLFEVRVPSCHPLMRMPWVCICCPSFQLCSGVSGEGSHLTTPFPDIVEIHMKCWAYQMEAETLWLRAVFVLESQFIGKEEGDDCNANKCFEKSPWMSPAIGSAG